MPVHGIRPRLSERRVRTHPEAQADGGGDDARSLGKEGRHRAAGSGHWHNGHAVLVSRTEAGNNRSPAAHGPLHRGR